MAYQFSGADLSYLLSSGGEDALTAAGRLALDDRSLLADLPRVRHRAGEHAGAVVETVRLRRRAVGKLPDSAAGWLFTDEALQQASPWPVALHRAARMLSAGLPIHDLTCSIGTDLAALHQLEPDRPVLGSDLDLVRLRMAAHNTGVPVIRANATTRVSHGCLLYADPARRASGSARRITGLDTIPPVAELDHVHRDEPAVLRLPPGIDYQRLDRPGEVEIVSLDGGARESVLWPLRFQQPGVRRRATVLSSDGTHWQVTDCDSDGGDATRTAGTGRYLMDPDPAVVRAHLVRHWAFRHGLRLVDEHLAYVTGDRVPAGVRAFEVLESAPLHEKTIAGWIRASGTGTLEIKQRGTGIDPDEFRRRFRRALSGATQVAATLVLARVGAGQQAYWCQAVRGPLPAGQDGSPTVSPC